METLVVALALAAPMAALNNDGNAGTRVGEMHGETKKKYSCFDAASWATHFKAGNGWRKFSQGYQDSVLHSLFRKSNLGTHNKQYVEFGFHTNDVDGTGPGSANHRRVVGRHPMSLAELSSAGANSELLQRQGWSGVRFDGDEEDRAKVPNMHKAFLTPFNVVHVFRAHNVTTEVDYVSIDIDSCDLWIFLALTDTYRPAVVSVEYQANYFFNESITNVCVRPQDPSNRAFFGTNKFTKGHWGYSASLVALAKAGAKRGYTLVWVEPLLDVFFVRNDLLCRQADGRPSAWQLTEANYGFATGLNLHAGRFPAKHDLSKLAKEFVSSGQELLDAWTVKYE